MDSQAEAVPNESFLEKFGGGRHKVGGYLTFEDCFKELYVDKEAFGKGIREFEGATKDRRVLTRRADDTKGNVYTIASIYQYDDGEPHYCASITFKGGVTGTGVAEVKTVQVVGGYEEEVLALLGAFDRNYSPVAEAIGGEEG